MRYTVFVGGCPGVGKSHLAAQLASTGFHHEIAGLLIRKGMSNGVGTYQRPVVVDANTGDQFQRILVEQFRQIRMAYDSVIILDGHFVLPTKEGLLPVSPGVFEALAIDAFVLIEAPLMTVVERLRNRETQKWWDGTEGSVSILMNAERIHAEQTARALNRPLRRLYGSDGDVATEVRDLVSKWLSFSR